MALTIFSIPPMSAGPERVFSGAKHTIGVERISLGAKMLEMAESLKSWVHITPGRTHAPLSGVFVNRQLLDEAIRVLEESGS
jgi:hypothetical protein